MIGVRKSEERGRANDAWLDRRLAFSYGDYQDPRHNGYGALKVLNEDRILGGGGFPMHDHDNVEVVTCMISGALEHRDSLGNHQILKPGDIQIFGAGSGASHSEFNASPADPVHFLQIYLEPRQRDLPPRCEARTFSETERKRQFRLVAAPDAAAGSLLIRQEAWIYAGLLARGETLRSPYQPTGHAWLQLVRGAARLNGALLRPGDGAAISGEPAIELVAADDSEFVMLDLG